MTGIPILRSWYRLIVPVKAEAPASSVPIMSELVSVDEASKYDDLARLLVDPESRITVLASLFRKVYQDGVADGYHFARRPR